jgi:DNA-binding NarL/FixJ family response regulator
MVAELEGNAPRDGKMARLESERREGRLLRVDLHAPAAVGVGAAALAAEQVRLAAAGEAQAGVRDAGRDQVLADGLGAVGREAQVVERAAALAAAAPAARRLAVLAECGGEGACAHCVRAGLHGCLARAAAPRDVARAVRTVAETGACFAPAQVAALVRAQQPAPAGPAPPARSPAPEHLTARERDVLRRVALGASSATIATQLGISVRTVDNHRRSIGQKLDLHRLADQVRFAIRAGLAEPE